MRPQRRLRARSKPAPAARRQRPRKPRLAHRQTASRGRTARASRICCRATPAVLREDRAQALVPLHHIATAPPPAPPHPAPLQAAPPRDVVGRARAPSSRCRNHSRRCAYDSGISAGRATARSAGRAAAASPRPLRQSLAPWAPRTGRGSHISTSRLARMRLISRVASSEWPPKLKEIVVDADPLDAPALPQTARTGSPPAACAAPATAASPRTSGAGSARRSSLPFGVSGSRSSTTNADGTM